MWPDQGKRTTPTPSGTRSALAPRQLGRIKTPTATVETFSPFSPVPSRQNRYAGPTPAGVFGVWQVLPRALTPEDDVPSPRLQGLVTVGSTAAQHRRHDALLLFGTTTSRLESLSAYLFGTLSCGCEMRIN
jgi:hypothetical protein